MESGLGSAMAPRKNSMAVMGPPAGPQAEEFGKAGPGAGLRNSIVSNAHRDHCAPGERGRNGGSNSAAMGVGSAQAKHLPPDGSGNRPMFHPYSLPNAVPTNANPAWMQMNPKKSIEYQQLLQKYATQQQQLEQQRHHQQQQQQRQQPMKQGHKRMQQRQPVEQQQAFQARQSSHHGKLQLQPQQEVGLQQKHKPRQFLQQRVAPQQSSQQHLFHEQKRQMPQQQQVLQPRSVAPRPLQARQLPQKPLHQQSFHEQQNRRPQQQSLHQHLMAQQLLQQQRQLPQKSLEQSYHEQQKRVLQQQSLQHQLLSRHSLQQRQLPQNPLKQSFHEQKTSHLGLQQLSVAEQTLHKRQLPQKPLQQSFQEQKASYPGQQQQRQQWTAPSTNVMMAQTLNHYSQGSVNIPPVYEYSQQRQTLQARTLPVQALATLIPANVAISRPAPMKTELIKEKKRKRKRTEKGGGDPPKKKPERKRGPKGKTTLVKIVEAIDAIKDRKGATHPAIKSWVLTKYPETSKDRWLYAFRSAVKGAIQEGILEHGSTHVRLKITAEGRRELRAANGHAPLQANFGEDGAQLRPLSAAAKKRRQLLHRRLRGASLSFVKTGTSSGKNSSRSSSTAVKSKLNAQIRKEKEMFAQRRRKWLGAHYSNFSPFLGPRAAASVGVKPLPRAAAPTVGPLEEQPECLKGGELREYQLVGLNWLRNLYHWGASGILADEMGLGKTVQTLALFGWLKESQGKKGPHLVLCPLSVTEAWLRECRKWLPKSRCVLFHGPPTKLQQLSSSVMARCEFDICISTYEVAVSKNASCLRGFAWRYFVLDEGHRVKNENTLCHKALSGFSSLHTLLLTGTPIQNNMHELWALLRFLYPGFFSSSEPFDRAFEHIHLKQDKELLKKAPALLEPLMLRRQKRDVEATLPPKEEVIVKLPMTPSQLELYKKILMTHAQLLDSASELGENKVGSDGWKQIKALFVELRKAACHPYLVQRNKWNEAKEKSGLPLGKSSGVPLVIPIRRRREAREGDIESRKCEVLKDMLDLSGKLKTLDQLLQRLKSEGHRVLIFSCFTTVLDLLSDFLRLKKYKFLRLDGSTNRVRRRVDISRYQALNSPYFVFLISNRAGGLGINLQTADTVVHFDSDWNPQADLQAQARSHRIGQKRLVRIYRLVSQDTVEERVLFRAQRKLYLDAMVSRKNEEKGLGSSTSSNGNEPKGSDILADIYFGAQRMFTAKQGDMEKGDLDTLLGRAQRIRQETGGEDANSRKDREDLMNYLGGQTPEATTTMKLTASNEFQGIVYTKKEEKKQDLLMYSSLNRRATQSRMMKVNSDGQTYHVLKENAKRKGSLYQKSSCFSIWDTRDHIKFQHEIHCAECYGQLDPNDSLKCASCPKAFHFDCDPGDTRGINGVSFSGGVGRGFVCPLHNCCVCGAGGTSRGMIFRCLGCPQAFCDEHCPKPLYLLKKEKREREEREAKKRAKESTEMLSQHIAEDQKGNGDIAEDKKGNDDIEEKQKKMDIEVENEEEGLEYVDSCSVMDAYGFKLPSNYMYVFCQPKCKRRYHDEYLKLPKPDFRLSYKNLPLPLRTAFRQKKSGKFTQRTLGELKVPEVEHGHFSGQSIREKLEQVEEESELPLELHRLLYNTIIPSEKHGKFIEALCQWKGFSLLHPASKAAEAASEEAETKGKGKKKGRGRPSKSKTKKKKQKTKKNKIDTAKMKLAIEEWEQEAVEFYEMCRRFCIQLRTETLTVLCDLLGICLCFAPRVNKNGVVSKARRRGIRTSDSREARARHLACILTLPHTSFMDISPGE